VRGVTRVGKRKEGERGGEREGRMDSNTGPPLGAPTQLRHWIDQLLKSIPN